MFWIHWFNNDRKYNEIDRRTMIIVPLVSTIYFY